MKRPLDSIDLRILKSIQCQARITNQALAELVHLSPSSCLQRVKRLEDNGYIHKYIAVLELNQICSFITCIATITFKGHDQNDFQDFVNEINEIPEVIECSTVSGQFDFILKLICKDMPRYLELNNYLLNACSKIGSIKTHVVMNENKKFEGFDLTALTSDIK